MPSSVRFVIFVVKALLFLFFERSTAVGENDLTHRVAKWVDHNRYLTLAVVLGLVLAIGLVACQPTTVALAGPQAVAGAKVDLATFEAQIVSETMRLQGMRAEVDKGNALYNAEVAAFNARVDAGRKDLEKQAAVKAELISIAGGIATAAVSGGQITAAQGVAAGIQVLSALCVGGLLLDNRRKDQVIAGKSAPTPAPAAT